MANSAKIRGRIYPSFQESELQKRDNKYRKARFGVIYIDGDKTKLFHFLWSTEVSLSLTQISDSGLREYYEVDFDPESSFFYLDQNGTWIDAKFKNYEKQKDDYLNHKLIFDESVAHGTKYALVGLPTYELLRLNRWFLSEED